MSNDESMQENISGDIEENPEGESSDQSEMENIIPDATLEKKVFLYGFGITLILWLYIIIVQDNALYFIIPAMLMTILMIFLFVRYTKKKNSRTWVETSFQDYKEQKKSDQQ